jgi:membrane-bound inhibitor of C-type lysozyme
MIRATAIAAAGLLAACGQADKPAEEAKKLGPEPIVAPAASAGRSVAYTCEQDLPITAIYGTNAEGRPDVTLIIQGQDFSLAETVAASGARYASADGITPGMGIIWWEKDGTAMLQQSPAGEVMNPEAGQTIRTCAVKS